MARPIKLPTVSGTFGPQAPAGTSAVGTPTGPGRVKYMGHSGIRETAGGAVTIRIHDAGAATGASVETIVLAANGFVPSVWKGPQGIDGTVGLYLEVVSGTGVIDGYALLG